MSKLYLAVLSVGLVAFIAQAECKLDWDSMVGRVSTLNVGEGKCAGCMEQLSKIRPHLTQGKLDRLVAERAETCKKTDAQQKFFLYADLVLAKLALQYLLSHTAEDTCIFFKACPDLRASGSSQFRLINQESNDISKRIKMARNQTRDCENCVKYSPDFKKVLTPQLIDAFAQLEYGHCEKIWSLPRWTDCIRNVGQFVEEANYLLRNTVEEYCNYIGACSLRKTLIGLPESKLDWDASLNVGEDKCQECSDLLGLTKAESTQEKLDDYISRSVHVCNVTSVPIEKDECYANIGIIELVIKYLLSHTPTETCKFFGACPSVAKFGSNLSKLISGQSDNISKGIKRNQNSNCDTCLWAAPVLKKALTSELIHGFKEVQIAKCLRIGQFSSGIQCLDMVHDFLDQADYLLRNSVEVYCEFYHKCT